MSVITLNNEIGFNLSSEFNHGIAVGAGWILFTGFWDDSLVWLDEQVWNDGV